LTPRLALEHPADFDLVRVSAMLEVDAAAKFAVAAVDRHERSMTVPIPAVFTRLDALEQRSSIPSAKKARYFRAYRPWQSASGCTARIPSCS
jgi:hypothetical protein